MGDAQSIPIIGEVVTVVESSVKMIAAGGTALVGAVAIPFIGDNNPILEAAGKLAEGAENSWVEYSEKSVIVGTINANRRERRGDEKGCKRVRDKVGKSFEGFFDSMPVVGHAKGIAHYAMGDIEHGNQCMLGATRGVAVTAVGALTGGLGAGVAGMYAGLAYDTVASAIDIGVHEEGKGNVHGIVANIKEFAETKDPNALVNIGLTAFVDYSAGAAGAKTPKETVKIQTKKNALKTAYKEPQHGLSKQHAALDAKTATKDTIKAARSQRLRSDMNVQEFKTKGQRSGFKFKPNAKKTACRGDFEHLPEVKAGRVPFEQQPEVKQVQSTLVIRTTSVIQISAVIPNLPV